jgi:hypothetical protein
MPKVRESKQLEQFSKNSEWLQHTRPRLLCKGLRQVKKSDSRELFESSLYSFSSIFRSPLRGFLDSLIKMRTEKDLEDEGLEAFEIEEEDKIEKEEEENIGKFQKKSEKSKAQMIFPISKILKQMKACDKDIRVSKKAALPISVALETLTAEIFTLAQNSSNKENNHSKIQTCHIFKIFQSNPVFKQLLGPKILVPFIFDNSPKKFQEIIEID